MVYEIETNKVSVYKAALINSHFHFNSQYEYLYRIVMVIHLIREKNKLFVSLAPSCVVIQLKILKYVFRFFGKTFTRCSSIQITIYVNRMLIATQFPKFVLLICLFATNLGVSLGTYSQSHIWISPREMGIYLLLPLASGLCLLRDTPDGFYFGAREWRVICLFHSFVLVFVCLLLYREDFM